MTRRLKSPWERLITSNSTSLSRIALINNVLRLRPIAATGRILATVYFARVDLFLQDDSMKNSASGPLRSGPWSPGGALKS